MGGEGAATERREEGQSRWRVEIDAWNTDAIPTVGFEKPDDHDGSRNTEILCQHYQPQLLCEELHVLT